MLATAGELVFGSGSSNVKLGRVSDGVETLTGRQAKAGKQKNHSTCRVEWFFTDQRLNACPNLGVRFGRTPKDGYCDPDLSVRAGRYLLPFALF